MYLNRYRPAAMAAAIVFLVVVSTSRAETLLRWKFTAGETQYYAISQDTVQRMEVGEQTIKTSNNMLMDLRWHIYEVAADGTTRLTQTFDRVRLRIQGPAFDFAYDSREKKPQDGPLAAMAGMFNSLIGAKFQLKMTPRGEVVEQKIPRELIEELKKLPTPAAAFSEDDLKQLGNMTIGLAVFPEKPVETGQSWSIKRDLKLPGFGLQAVEMKFTYLGKESLAGKPLEKIGYQTQVALDLSKLLANTGMKLEPAESLIKGEIWFDAAAGQLRHVKMTQAMDLQGKLGEQDYKQQVRTTMQMRRTSKTDEAETEKDKEDQTDETEAEKQPAARS